MQVESSAKPLLTIDGVEKVQRQRISALKRFPILKIPRFKDSRF